MASKENEIQEFKSDSSKVNPFLMPQVIERIYNGLDLANDLLACHDICLEWRRLAPPYILEKLEIRVTQNADKNVELQNYLQMIRDFPNLKAQKYVFEDADFNSPTVKRILSECGPEMKKLTLSYPSRKNKYEDYFRRTWVREGYGDPRLCADKNLISSQDFHDLLLNKAPLLETLILKAIPGCIIRTKILPVSLLSQLESNQTRQLSLRRIQFYMGKVPSYSAEFLDDLFSICPKLEDVIVVAGYKQFGTSELNIVGSLVRTSRIKQLKKLKIEYMSQEIMELLNANLAYAQLEICFFDELSNVTSESLQHFLNQQSPSSQQLQLRLENTCVNFPPMPKLTQLILLAYKRREAENGAEPAPLEPLPDFHLHFPKLRLLKLEKSWNFVQEILPTHLSLITQPPNLALQVLQTIPRGVDELMMERLGKLFPNLTKLRTGIPFGCEALLISVWKFCPNITDLFLSLDTRVDYDGQQQKTSRQRNDNGRRERSLDSIFSGIPDEVLQANLSSMNSNKELRRFDFNKIRSNSSICDLKKLRRLYIGRFGPELMHWHFTDDREDLFLDIVGYSTFACLGPEITFFQLESHVHNLRERCKKFIGSKMKLTKVDPFPLHFCLIKSGCGFEQMKAFPPLEWLGYGQYEENDVDLPEWVNKMHDYFRYGVRPVDLSYDYAKCISLSRNF